MIRKLVVLAVVSVVSVSSVAGEGIGIAVVDMELLIKTHSRTKADTAILEKYIEDFQAERDEMSESLRALGAELEELGKEVADTALSDKAREEKRSLARAKLEEYQELKQKLREVTNRRQKELSSQELLMRKRVVSEIREAIKGVATDKKVGLVLDSTGMGMGAYSTVMYHLDEFDITDDVITAMPKDDGK